MTKLVLKVGDKVRNIKKDSSHYLRRGVIWDVSANLYFVAYDSNIVSYSKKTAHNHLEKVEDALHQCKCVQHDEVCDKCARQMLKSFLLKKERRNVITGKTQSEMIKQCGTALGVTQFNTRTLGKSTGQAMAKIGEAMLHPNVPVRIVDVDHAITERGALRHIVNMCFAEDIEDIIRKQGLKGLHLLNGEELLYLPIVTEETYVNI